MPPEVIGHRGARSLFPENTIEGFAASIARGIHHFEIDVGMTRDGAVVLSHDPQLNPATTRSADGAWLQPPWPPICALDYRQLQAFDVGRLNPAAPYGRAFPRQTSIDGARIPRLDQVLRMDHATRWTIEIKTSPLHPRLTASPEAIAEAVADIAGQAGADCRITVQSFDWRGPRHLRRLRPDLRYAWLTCARTRSWRGGQRPLPATAAAEGGGTWSPQYQELTRRRLDAAKGIGLRIVPWTVNDPSAAQRLAAWGVDGIITDDPVAAADWLRCARGA